MSTLSAERENRYIATETPNTFQTKETLTKTMATRTRTVSQTNEETSKPTHHQIYPPLPTGAHGHNSLTSTPFHLNPHPQRPSHLLSNTPKHHSKYSIQSANTSGAPPTAGTTRPALPCRPRKCPVQKPVRSAPTKCREQSSTVPASRESSASRM